MFIIFIQTKTPKIMMGGGAGSIASMIATLKNNALLLKKRRSLGEIEKEYGGKPKHIELIHKDASEAELRAFHLKLIHARRKANILQGILIVIFLAIAVVGTYFFIKAIS